MLSLVKDCLVSLINCSHDGCMKEFAKCRSIGCELYIKPGSFILFVDFSSAFNTTQPHLMAAKLLAMNVCDRMVLWMLVVWYRAPSPSDIKLLFPLLGLGLLALPRVLFFLQFCSPSIRTNANAMILLYDVLNILMTQQ